MSDAGARRLLRRAIASVGLAAVIGSCTPFFGLDGYVSAPADLCAVLQACYPSGAMDGCEQHLTAGLKDPEGATWLQLYADQRCADSCTAARHCLNLRPICGTSTCEHREDCCGFVKGLADCSPKEHRCCLTRGVRCDPSGSSACCAGAGPCAYDVDAHAYTCGAVVCRDVDKACQDNEQCCTKVCKDGVCAEACRQEGFDCTDDGDCCDGSCVGDKCVLPMCVTLGQSCAGGKSCCGGLSCMNPTTGSGPVCLPAGGCFPNNTDCATDDQCCNKRCDPTYFVCSAPCTMAGTMCAGNEDCCSGACAGGLCADACSTTYCDPTSPGQDCCAGLQCTKGTCAPSCNIASCQEDPLWWCVTGGPRNQSCDACAQSVCAIDDYCCCGAWDETCVMEAMSLNGVCAPACP